MSSSLGKQSFMLLYALLIRASRSAVLVAVLQATNASLQHHCKQVLRLGHRWRHWSQRHHYGPGVLPHAKGLSVRQLLDSAITATTTFDFCLIGQFFRRYSMLGRVLPK